MHNTSYPSVNHFLRQFHGDVVGILGDNFIGMYLYGSLAIGDFDEASSDVDVLVVTGQPVSPVEMAGLQNLHATIQRGTSPWRHRLEVSYTPRKAIQRYDPSDNRYPLISPVSPFGTIAHGKDWILNRAILRRSGVVVAGPAPRTLVDKVSPKTVRRTARELLCEQWSKHVDGPEWMKPRKYQAFAVLTLCRMLYAIETGEPTTKPKAAAWATANLDSRWRPLIAWALAHRADGSEGPMDETLGFLRFVIAQHCPGR